MIVSTSPREAELPPRARRILHIIPVDGDGFGTTSACAENTFCITLRFSFFWNYLRVRGEYDQITQNKPKDSELPPRARRILFRLKLDRKS